MASAFKIYHYFITFWGDGRNGVYNFDKLKSTIQAAS